MEWKNLLTTFSLISTLLVSTWAQAAGLMKPSGSNLPDLEIKTHHVNVVIEDGYVTTAIEQVFHNPNPSDLEAIYSFPVPEGAAVGEFIYWINDQPVTGEVMQKQQAKTLYESEKAAGRNTALAEKDAYRTFDMHVYPIRAQSEVKIRLVYIQSAQVDTGVGRYLYPLEDGGVDEQKLAFWSRNETVSEQFSFNLRFRSSYPVDAFRLPNHPNAVIQQTDANEWSVQWTRQHNPEDMGNSTPAAKLNQDIVVYWRHQDGLPGSLDLTTYKTAVEPKGTFMLTLTPGEDFTPIMQGSDWVFVLDVSGSMQGKYATLVEGVRQGLAKLRPDDRFKVILFNNTSVDLTGGFQNTTENNVNHTLTALQHFGIGGGTNLYAGLTLGLNNLDSDRPTGVILVTDGVANVGTTEKKEFLSLLENHDVRLFTFIMGNSANRPLLKEMTQVSNGFAMSVSNADDIVGQIMSATSKLTHHALTDVSLAIDGVRVSDVTPESIGSLYRGQQLKLMGHYWTSGSAKITLNATLAGQTKTYQTVVTFPSQNTRNPELERLWAFAAIENLQAKLAYLGEDADAEQAITDIALEYGLVTDFTSMIVAEEDVFQAMNIERKNKQRVATEQQARQDRLADEVPPSTQNQNPMFSHPRPSHSNGGGAGAMGPLSLITLIVLLLLAANRHQRSTRQSP